VHVYAMGYVHEYVKFICYEHGFQPIMVKCTLAQSGAQANQFSSSQFKYLY